MWDQGSGNLDDPPKDPPKNTPGPLDKQFWDAVGGAKYNDPGFWTHPNHGYGNTKTSEQTAITKTVGEGGGGDPFINIELNIKFGLEVTEKLKVFGLGEEFKVNAISIDYMTFNWNSTTTGIKYTPYRTATSSLSIGTFGLYGGVKQDWGKMQFAPYGQLGLTYLERGTPTRFNIIDYY